MYPVLISFGQFSLASFGVFLGIGVIAAIFTAWRLARLEEIPAEKMFDLILIVFFGGLLFARLVAVLTNWSFFDSLQKILAINLYPGLSFWGGFLGGIVLLIIFCRIIKLNFWQMADILAVSFLIGDFFGNLGCFLGGCAYGIPSNAFWAIAVVGLIGKRVPVPLIESLLVLLIFRHLQKKVHRFHLHGTIAAQFLIYFGLVKFVTELWRADQLRLPFLNISGGFLLSFLLIVAGVVIYYYRSKRSWLNDLKGIGLFFTSGKKRQSILLQFQKKCYNLKIVWQLRLKHGQEKLKNLPKILKKKLNVKSIPTDHQ